MAVVAGAVGPDDRPGSDDIGDEVREVVADLVRDVTHSDPTQAGGVISLVHAHDPAHVLLPAVHRVASLLKRWLAGTLHHGQSFDHLAYYLDEFTFRFNRRNSRSRGLLFYRLAHNAVAIEPHPLNSLTATQSADLS